MTGKSIISQDIAIGKANNRNLPAEFPVKAMGKISFSEERQSMPIVL
jgi:hypothetical protein